ncbi:MAG: VOC family protein [Pseudomonadota bacterium]
MIKSLGYIGCAVTNLNAWHDLLVNQIGLSKNADISTITRHHYRMDRASSRITLESSTRDELLYLGWDMGSLASLEQLSNALRDVGLKVDDASPDEARHRHVEIMRRFVGPDGVQHEIFCNQDQATEGFSSAIMQGGFKTGPSGLGHAVLAASDRLGAATWYMETLGFRLSDEILWDDAQATFMHCNARHHSLAILNCCMGMQPGDLNHIMVEMENLEDVGRAYDRVRAAGTPLALQIGQHINDKVVSFYLITPSGSAIEVGYGGIEIESSTWQPQTFDTPKIWGHDPAGNQGVV